MLKNWINVFTYHIKNNKLFTVLNVLGLSIGIAGLIFAILYWNEEYSYDKWNPEKDKTYIVLNDIGNESVWATNSPITAPALKSSTSYLDNYCYFRTYYTKEIITYNGKQELVDKIFSAQSSFFSFFPFEFIRGNRKTAIHDRNSIVLSDETAARLFKDEDPMGKQVKYADQFFVVRGVYRLSGKSVVMPAAITTIVEDELKKNRESWGFSYGLILKLKKQSDTTAVIKKLDEIFMEQNYKKQAKDEGLSLDAFIKMYGDPVKAQLLPLNGSRLSKGNYPFPEGTGNLQFLRILMGLSILILLLSIVNYINLATANAVKRAKEVGVRKIVGAAKFQIIAQFVFETILITLFSLLLALVIVELSLPFYNSFLNKNLVLIGSQFYLQLILIFFLVVFVSGVLPAVYISNFEVLKVLKGNFSRSKNGVWLRNGMLILQFAIAAFFIIGSFIVYKQVSYMAEKDLGFKGAQVIDISFKPQKGKEQFERYKTIRQELLKIKGIEAVSTGTFSIGSGNNSWSGMHYKANKEVITQQMGIDFGLLDILGIKIIKGRNLSDKLASDSISNILLNEAAAKTMQEKDPVNKEITWNNHKFKVVGIVKDFNYFGLEHTIAPMIFFHINAYNSSEEEIKTISVKIAPQEMSKTIAALDKFWRAKVDTKYPFEYNFVDSNFARTYKKYENQSNLFSLLNGIVILIAVFGLFALASYSMERRLREIAIRKTLGAETNLLLKELSKQYVVFCVIGFLIGIIPAYLLLRKWLEDFAYRIDIPLLPFLVAFAFLMLLTLTIVLAKAYQVTKIDILKYLKYE
ncbi:putative ABC transport system permease protein [Flavobacterium sp. CF108]|uniref:ABC transporter permease n=1 Tax=unclassified Flavobacterium TaxID=196869 RepID=UPI0008CC32CD|nr:MULTISPECIES: ABC transporter permease [unclassified Flavobacterium]SEO55710.1 putative ABC transport system permease protein [Flavobacterium sp. fv08]SHH76214.1 putative ABC transport system permease protein [Flavobacterium sp. CF108]